MRFALRLALPIVAVTLSVAILNAQPQSKTEISDPLLRAMKDEMERSKQLHILNLDPPYWFEYRVEDTRSVAISASLGALISSAEARTRIPMVQVRVGDYNFDNTNHVYSDAYSGTRYDSGQLPIDDNYKAFRQAFWLATDRAFKSAEDAIARKRSSLKNVNLPDTLPDFSRTPAVEAVLPIKLVAPDKKQWADRILKLSAIFDKYPQVLSSFVDVQISQSTNYVVNSEGTMERTPEDLATVRIQGRALAADGTAVRDDESINAFNAAGLPSENDLRHQTIDVAEHVTALAKAPVGEAYDGPVLFEARAAAQLFGQLLGDNLKLTRKPIVDAGRTAPYFPSEFENRLGSRVLPEWMDVVDDPTQTEWHGQTLLGHYQYDMEGVAAQPLTVVDKGLLKSFLLTRTPTYKGFESSNGRARLAGSFGARAPGFSNLFIRASETKPAADMKKVLMELCQQRNKPYGILIRKLDFPSTASIDEFRRMAAEMGRSGGGSHLVAQPLLVYKVYPDGKEELIRNVRFSGLTPRSLRDIAAASDEHYVFSFTDSNAPLALVGAGNYTTSASVIAPAVLFDELELAPIQEEVSKPPVVPAPPLSESSTSARTVSPARAD
ncbi:MAG TPA: metallopeptidase TldD-related protein [Bryobacteraceae bacterium]|nr:metallopeptidase TldD-related protein [Bryobacteraceae bacterium]